LVGRVGVSDQMPDTPNMTKIGHIGCVPLECLTLRHARSQAKTILHHGKIKKIKEN